MKEPEPIMEGTGEEVSNYAKAHPHERFRLTAVPKGKKKKPEKSRIAEALKIIETFRDKVPVLPPEAFSRDSIYR